MTATPQQWLPDPSRRHLYRWWDGAQWTGHVADGQILGWDPPPAPPAQSPPMLLETRAFDDGKPPARDTSGRGRKALLIAGSLLAVGLVGQVIDDDDPVQVTTTASRPGADARPSSAAPTRSTGRPSTAAARGSTAPAPAIDAPSVPVPRRTTKRPTAAPRKTTAEPAPLLGGNGVDPRFSTCKEAKAHGYGHYRQGEDPEYDWYRDADHDGVVCE